MEQAEQADGGSRLVSFHSFLPTLLLVLTADELRRAAGTDEVAVQTPAQLRTFRSDGFISNVPHCDVELAALGNEHMLTIQSETCLHKTSPSISSSAAA